jgi:hypothetical protein
MMMEEKPKASKLMGCLLLMVGIIILAVCAFNGMSDPRVIQCRDCGAIAGMIRGLPGQSKCQLCDGWENQKGWGDNMVKVRDLTWKEWNAAKERGYVTLQDGTPVD